MFSKGDFRNSDIDFIAIGGGRHWMTVYAFIYYKDEQLNVSKRVTARIEVDTWQSYIEEVVYSSEL